MTLLQPGTTSMGASSSSTIDTQVRTMARTASAVQDLADNSGAEDRQGRLT